ncbi:16S rRNA (cytosine(1402)-N(4))-methyltransferase [bacterium B17]|nr:16S rRNA (cytosine(1402)-N(4))-methyltransferase [bacterium B17]
MHESVLLKETVELLQVKKGGTYIDGTLGNAGHSLAILEQAGPGSVLMGIDRDKSALERAKERLQSTEGNVMLVHGNYADMDRIAEERGIREVDGVFLDIGVSSFQLDEPERGFSFNSNGPLDMRMDQSSGQSAADIVNGAEEEELAQVIREFGEEKRARRIASAIVRRREKDLIATTGALAEVVDVAVGGRRGGKHPATKTFQALRIAVNGELEALERGLDAGIGLLREGGRMGVITFHSLEDRIVKRFFASHAGKWRSLEEGGSRWEGSLPTVKRVTRKPVMPSEEEIERNKRSRSAKLRVVERSDFLSEKGAGDGQT